MSIQRVQALVRTTGEKIYVKDAPYVLGIIRYYNPTHEDEEGREYHDDELIFLEPRLQ